MDRPDPIPEGNNRDRDIARAAEFARIEAVRAAIQTLVLQIDEVQQQIIRQLGENPQRLDLQRQLQELQQDREVLVNILHEKDLQDDSGILSRLWVEHHRQPEPAFNSAQLHFRLSPLLEVIQARRNR